MSSRVDFRMTRRTGEPALRLLAVTIAAVTAFALGYLVPQALPGFDQDARPNAAGPTVESRPGGPVTGQRVLEDDFTSAIKTEKFWNTIDKSQKSSGPASNGLDQTGKSGLTTAPFWSPFGPVPDDLAGQDDEPLHDNNVYSQQRKTYRTVCVRLCDGHYFPVSYATTTDHFDEDETKCRSTCGTPARLYFYPNPGGEPEDMRDRSGRAYINLETAFLYRTRYDAACTCQPQPWSDKAKARHQLYALYEAKTGGDKLASAEIEKLLASHPELRASTLLADAAKLTRTDPKPANSDGSKAVRFAERHDPGDPVSPQSGLGNGPKVVTDFAEPIQPPKESQPAKPRRQVPGLAEKKPGQRSGKRAKQTAQDVFRSNLMGAGF